MTTPSPCPDRINPDMHSLKLVALLATVAATLAACAQPGQRPAASPDTVQGNAPAKPKITAAQLLGQSDAWLLDKMGEPHFKRADRVANIWQYKNGVCMINVFLYADAPDAPTTTPAPTRVLHFDARDANGEATDRDQCLNTLQD